MTFLVLIKEQAVFFVINSWYQLSQQAQSFFYPRNTEENIFLVFTNSEMAFSYADFSEVDGTIAKWEKRKL